MGISWIKFSGDRLSELLDFIEVLFPFRYFNERINIYCEFIPEMIFLFCIFGYLVILIFYKWLAYDASEASCAPSLLIGDLFRTIYEAFLKALINSYNTLYSCYLHSAWHVGWKVRYLVCLFVCFIFCLLIYD